MTNSNTNSNKNLATIEILTESFATPFSGYDEESSQWKTMLEFDPDRGHISCETSYGNGTSLAVWNGKVLTIGQVPNDIADASIIIDWLEEEGTREKLIAIQGGYSEKWDGSNHRGVLTSESHEALFDLQESFKDLLQCGYSAYWNQDWFCGRPCYELVYATTDEQVEEMARAIVEQEAPEYILCEERLVRELRAMRAEMAEKRLEDIGGEDYLDELQEQVAEHSEIWYACSSARHGDYYAMLQILKHYEAQAKKAQ